MSVWALVMAAGSGERMALGQNKVLYSLHGKTVLERSAAAFRGLVEGVVVVARACDIEAVRALSLPCAEIVVGGATRQQSVLCGLKALPDEAEIVLVHDAARPFVSREVIMRCVDAARRYGSGVASVAVKDTVKRVNGKGVVLETPRRDGLRAAQTPQAFEVCALRRAIEALEARGETATDDAGAMEAAGHPVRLVEGAPENIKLTTPEDLQMAEWMLSRQERAPQMRVGYGYDVHRLVEGRDLVLCGVTLPHEKGLLGHSDADVALHALMDALLGAAGLGDIGTHFPDTDARYKGISSILLLQSVVERVRESGYAVCNVDVTIAAQRPKLKPYIPEMIEVTARALGIAPDSMNVKATTTEGLGFEGEGLGMSAHAVAMLMGAES